MTEADRPRLIRVTDPADPAIAAFVSIRERDLVRTQDRFIAEGTVVLTMLASPAAAANGFAIERLLVLENRLAGLMPVIGRLPVDVPVHVASQPVLDAIAGFHLHRGVLALGRRAAPLDAAGLVARLPDAALVVAASGISNHDNIGSLFRNAAAFGVDAVLLDDTCCDPLYRKALRVSVGAVLAVPHARAGSSDDLIGLLDATGFDLWGLSPSGSTDIRALPDARRVALLAGAEGEGLPKAVLARIRTLRIPQVAGLDSLNVGTATGIALFSVASRLGRI